LPAHGLNLIQLRGVGHDVNCASAIPIDFGMHGRKRRHIAAMNRDLGSVFCE
jgi:hypothetical protein